MIAPIVHCDDCGWEDTVRSIRHLRAWFRAACPACGQGELIDEREARIAEEIIALESEGLVRLHNDAPLKPGELVMKLDTAAPDLISSLSTGD